MVRRKGEEFTTTILLVVVDQSKNIEVIGTPAMPLLPPIIKTQQVSWWYTNRCPDALTIQVTTQIFTFFRRANSLQIVT